MAADPEMVWLPPELLRPNTWNPNKMDAFMYSRAMESIKRFGFIDPITARPFKGKAEIIDGEHRWRVAQDLGLAMIPVIMLELTDPQARTLTILLNELRGTAKPDDLGSLLKELLETEPMAELASVLPFTDEALAGMAELSDFDWGALEAPVKEPLVADKEKWVERTYRLPASAALVLDEAIEKAADGEAIDAWQALERIAADFLSS